MQLQLRNDPSTCSEGKVNQPESHQKSIIQKPKKEIPCSSQTANELSWVIIEQRDAIFVAV